jgi:DNA-binding LacI/PurR family transcriptional regulator
MHVCRRKRLRYAGMVGRNGRNAAERIQGVAMSAKRVTLRDVAAASCVSRATASLVLRDSPNMSVSPATRERVRKAARDLGYVPNGIARALREGSSRIVVLSVDSGFDGHYARSFTSGLDDELARHGHVLLVRHGHSAPDSTQQVLDAIAPRAVLRLTGNQLTLGRESDDGGWNGGLAGNTAVQLRYLVSRGHTHIATAFPDSEPPLGPVRMRFARETAGTLGIPPPQPLVVPHDRAACASAVKAFLAGHDAITAAAAFDDDVALRILTALRDIGLTAPRDLAVIGFDDNGYGALTAPALTTVRIDAEDHGRSTARTILGLEPVWLRAAPAQVIVRESALTAP